MASTGRENIKNARFNPVALLSSFPSNEVLARIAHHSSRTADTSTFVDIPRDLPICLSSATSVLLRAVKRRCIQVTGSDYTCRATTMIKLSPISSSRI